MSKEHLDAFEKVEAIKAGPKWRLYALVAVLAFCAAYLMWAMLKTPPAKPGEFSEANPAVVTPKIEGPVVSVPIKVIPKEQVKKKYPQYNKADEKKDVVIDSANIPPMENGVVTITKLDTTTGEASTSFEPKKSPLFAFSDKNYIGAGYRLSSEGASIPVYWKRDIFQVKGLHFQTEIGGRVPVNGNEKGEVHISGNVEYRFNGFNPFR